MHIGTGEVPWVEIKRKTPLRAAWRQRLVVEETAFSGLVEQPRVALEVEDARWQGKFGHSPLAPIAAA